MQSDLKLVPDGPNRMEVQNGMRIEIAQLEQSLTDAQAMLEAQVGPPPKKYSAVARMRLKDGTMGDGAQSSDGDGGIDPSAIMPGGNLVNIFGSLAVVAAAVFVLAPK